MFVSREKPYYPLAARQRGIAGSGVFRLYIDEQGRVTKIGVLASTGNKEMDASAMHAMVHWRTKPGPKREVDAPVTFTTTTWRDTPQRGAEGGSLRISTNLPELSGADGSVCESRFFSATSAAQVAVVFEYGAETRVEFKARMLRKSRAAAFSPRIER
jgi:TonB family protein